jgi:mono/diheme cytochrome c family protein
VARGLYLVNSVLNCWGCHTTDAGSVQTDPGFLAGGRAFGNTNLADGGPSRIYAKNLTPSDAGLASWSLQQIVTAIKTGMDDQGMPLNSTMNYPLYSNLSDVDAMSIAMYLKSLAPNQNVVPEDTNITAMVSPLINGTLIAHTSLPSTDMKFASAENGRYMATLVCMDCHTSRVTDGGTPPQILSMAFAGGRPSGATGLKSANLTPDNVTGLGTWTAADITATLTTQIEKGDGGTLCTAMPKFPTINSSDLVDIGEFLHTMPAIVNGPFHDGGC